MFGIIPGRDLRRLHQMILDNWLAQRAETCPDRVALISGGVGLTYEELEAEASRAARRLAARRVRACDDERSRPAAARGARPRRPALPDPDERHLGEPPLGGPHLRQSPVERGRLGVQPGS